MRRLFLLRPFYFLIINGGLVNEVNVVHDVRHPTCERRRHLSGVNHHPMGDSRVNRHHLGAIHGQASVIGSAKNVNHHHSDAILLKEYVKAYVTDLGDIRHRFRHQLGERHRVKVCTPEYLVLLVELFRHLTNRYGVLGDQNDPMDTSIRSHLELGERDEDSTNHRVNRIQRVQFVRRNNLHTKCVCANGSRNQTRHPSVFAKTNRSRSHKCSLGSNGKRQVT